MADWKGRTDEHTGRERRVKIWQPSAGSHPEGRRCIHRVARHIPDRIWDEWSPRTLGYHIERAAGRTYDSEGLRTALRGGVLDWEDDTRSVRRGWAAIPRACAVRPEDGGELGRRLGAWGPGSEIRLRRGQPEVGRDSGRV